MKYLLIAILLTTSMFSCKSSKEFHEKENIENKLIESDMKDKGFKLGTIKKLAKEKKCEYIIEIDGETKYDPINLLDEFKVSDQEVWVKFIWLRRASRCLNTIPIQITEMVKK